MAKLNRQMQRQTENASDGFDPLPDRTYHLRLREVHTDRPPGPAGPYWVWEFEVVEEVTFEVVGDDGSRSEQQAAGRRLWNNTSLAPQAAFKMKETFRAFGASVDTDTDDLCGQVVKAVVSTRVIQSGPRKGEVSNQIDKLMPADEGFEVPESMRATGAGQPAAEDIF